MGKSEHSARASLQRSLAAFTIGAPQAFTEREDELYPLRAMDMAQNLQAPVRGTVFKHPIWATLTVNFPNPFIMAADATARGVDTTLSTPNFSYGFEVQSGPDLWLTVNLRSWEADDRDFYSGAVLRVGAWLPEAPKRESFTGLLHLTFTGYAAPSDDDSEG